MRLQRRAPSAASTAVSRLVCASFSVPIVKFPFALVSQPDGGGEDGAMPSGTACARLEAAKKSGARKLELRMVRIRGG